MRIAEKTVELNFCKGFPLILGHDLFWFGLTQKQEAQAGFDACAKSGSTLMLFQLKASRLVLKDGSRRFLAEHDQMQTLRDQVKANRLVYYVLPRIGTTADVCGGLCLSHCSRYLDVSQLPSKIPPPFAKGKKPPAVRKNNCHYIDMAPALHKATIHSDPFDVALLNATTFVNTFDQAKEMRSDRREGRHEHRVQEISGGPCNSDEFGEFWSALSLIDRSGLFGAYAL